MAGQEPEKWVRRCFNTVVDKEEQGKLPALKALSHVISSCDIPETYITIQLILYITPVFVPAGQCTKV